MSRTIINFVRRKLGWDVDETTETPPQNLEEVISKLPASFQNYINEELYYRRIAAIVFILLVVMLGFPLWYYTTAAERFPFATFPKSQKIIFDIKISTACTDQRVCDELTSFDSTIVEKLSGSEVVDPLQIKWSIESKGKKSLEAAGNDRKPSFGSSLEVKVLAIPSGDWPFFSATNVHMSKGEWAFFQWKEDESKEKRIERFCELIREVLVDVPHLNVIVRRDLRQRMEPWQIATLPLSHQKRLVWDSAPLAMHYIVQIMHIHDNARPTEYDTNKTEIVVRKLAQKLKEITIMEVTSEHLWDFSISSFLEKDVQDRWTLTNANMERVIKEVDSYSQSVESDYPLLKIVVLETLEPIIMLDHYDEDSRGAAIASWGAVVPRTPLTESRILASMRVLLGIDAELGTGWTRESVPLAFWELNRMRLRATLDNAMRGISAVATLKVLEEEITTIVINEDVASKANRAVDFIKKGLASSESPDLAYIKKGRLLADEAISHPSLLSILYFPQDQTFAVYVPILLPILMPFIASLYQLFNWIVLDPINKLPSLTYYSIVAIGISFFSYLANRMLSNYLIPGN